MAKAPSSPTCPGCIPIIYVGMYRSSRTHLRSVPGDGPMDQTLILRRMRLTSATMRPPMPDLSLTGLAHALALQPRRFEMQMQFIDERISLDAIPHPMEERGIGEASHVELVGQVVLQLLGSLRVRCWICRRPPLLEQLIHPRIAVLREVEGSGRLEKRRKGPDGKSRDIAHRGLKIVLAHEAVHPGNLIQHFDLHLHPDALQLCLEEGGHIGESRLDGRREEGKGERMARSISRLLQQSFGLLRVIGISLHEAVVARHPRCQHANAGLAVAEEAQLNSLLPVQA